MTKDQKVRKAHRWVRDMQLVLPTTAPVYVSARDVTGDGYGSCEKKVKGFELRVLWIYPWEIIRDFLLPHEYAHARVWGRLQAGTRDHDAHFDIELGVVDREAEEVIIAEHIRDAKKEQQNASMER